MLKNKDYILIIDDDKDQQVLLSKFISKLGYQTKSALTAAEGIQLTTEELPALVLLDIILPDEAGMIVLNKLQSNEKTKNVPVIIITSMQDDEIVIAALASGASDVLTKPIRYAQLLPRINKAFEIAEYQKKLKVLNTKLEADKEGLLRYFPDDVVTQILKGEIQPELGGQITDATIMFMDLRNSTALAESLPTDEFVNLLNLFFADVFDIVFGIQGSVNKMLGDGMLATFGCPVKTANDADNCAQAALRIVEHLELFNMYRPDYMKSELGIGIGIASGKVFAGNIGSKRLMEYTVIGDPVNLASRLESLNKKMETRILIDETTRLKLSDKFQASFKTKALVRGKNIPVSIYTLDKPSSSAST